MKIIETIKDEFDKANTLIKIIYINIFVFLLLNILSVSAELFLYEWSSIFEKLKLPSETSEIIKQPWSLFTFMFVHNNFTHLILNMLWLYFGGKLFLDYLNEKQLIYTYLLGGVIGGLVFISAFNYFPKLINDFLGEPLVGSSASVIAVFFGITTKVPNYQIRLPFIGFIKLKYISLFLFVVSFSLLGGINPGGNFAHIGGAIFGYIYIKQLQKKKGSIFYDLIKKFKKPNQKKFKKQTSEVDIVLEKISKSGYASLNKKEKELLFKSSKK